MTRNHPEKKPNERFIGNQDGKVIGSHLHEFESLRLAQPAFDIEGKRLPDNYYAIFLDQKDYGKYNRIMENRLSSITSYKRLK